MKVTSLGANQTVISTKNWEILVSYSTPVAAVNKCDGRPYKTDENWSKTTSKHINGWLLKGNLATLKPQKWFDELLDSNEPTN